jgi:hypothetical protein
VRPLSKSVRLSTRRNEKKDPVEKQNQNECGCEKSSGGCSGAGVERCPCGNKCDCEPNCECAGGCGCKTDK